MMIYKNIIRSVLFGTIIHKILSSLAKILHKGDTESLTNADSSTNTKKLFSAKVPIILSRLAHSRLAHSRLAPKT